MSGHDPRAVALLLLAVADDLERRAYPAVGAVRVAAQMLSEAGEPTPGAASCPTCGGVVEQPRTGRPRRYCTQCRPGASR